MIESIASTTITAVAQRVFDPSARVASVHKITPAEQHGITRVAESTRNLLYKVRLAEHAQPYVFRFARAAGGDVYPREVRNYQRLAEHTGVRVPTVYAVDRSQRIVPTAYMVMDYLQGEDWQYLTHPDNPDTTRREKSAIRHTVGRFYARVHGVTPAAAPAREEVRVVMDALDRLEAATARGVIDVAPGTIDRCRQAVAEEPSFHEALLSLCMIDTEIHFSRHDGAWKLAFVCDAEWAGYRHRYADLTPMLTGASAWWEADRPLADTDPAEIAERPFFRGYEAVRAVNYERLWHLSPYYELDRWAHLASTAHSPAKKQWIKTCKEPLIQALVHRIAARA